MGHGKTVEEKLDYLISRLESLDKRINGRYVKPENGVKEFYEANMDKITEYSTSEVYGEYVNYCEENHIQPISSIGFSRKIKQFGFEVRQKMEKGVFKRKYVETE